MWVYNRFFKVISKIILTCEMLHILMFKIYANPSFLNIVNMFNFIVSFFLIETVNVNKTKNLKKSFVSLNQKSPKYPHVIKFAGIFTSLLKLKFMITDNVRFSEKNVGCVFLCGFLGKLVFFIHIYFCWICFLSFYNWLMLGCCSRGKKCLTHVCIFFIYNRLDLFLCLWYTIF